MTDRELAELTRSILERVREEMLPRRVCGTFQQQLGTGEVSVQLDESPSGSLTTVINLADLTGVGGGDRVSLEFWPPNTYYLTHVVP